MHHYKICPDCECNHLKVSMEPMRDYNPRTGEQRVIGQAYEYRCHRCDWVVRIEEVSESFEHAREQSF